MQRGNCLRPRSISKQKGLNYYKKFLKDLCDCELLLCLSCYIGIAFCFRDYFKQGWIVATAAFVVIICSLKSHLHVLSIDTTLMFI